MNKKIIIDLDEYLDLESKKKCYEENIETIKNRVLLTFEDYEKYRTIEQRIYKAIDLLFEEYESCEGALSNPEHTIISKHTLLKNEKDAIKKIIDLLKGETKD